MKHIAKVKGEKIRENEVIFTYCSPDTIKYDFVLHEWSNGIMKRRHEVYCTNATYSFKLIETGSKSLRIEDAISNASNPDNYIIKSIVSMRVWINEPISKNGLKETLLHKSLSNDDLMVEKLYKADSHVFMEYSENKKAMIPTILQRNGTLSLMQNAPYLIVKDQYRNIYKEGGRIDGLSEYTYHHSNDPLILSRKTEKNERSRQ